MNPDEVVIDVDFRLGDPAPWTAIVRSALFAVKSGELPSRVLVTRPIYDRADFRVVVQVPRADGKPKAAAGSDFTKEFAEHSDMFAQVISKLTIVASKHQRTAALPTEGG